MEKHVDKEEAAFRRVGNRHLREFATLLERAGFRGALELIRTELVPLARNSHLCLHDAAWRYANHDAAPDSIPFKFFTALDRIQRNYNNLLSELSIYKQL